MAAISTSCTLRVARASSVLVFQDAKDGGYHQMECYRTGPSSSKPMKGLGSECREVPGSGEVLDTLIRLGL